jgi:NAD(P)-dependent dehydrogenase (short-subunit alcohol dehydrogenase family)
VEAHGYDVILACRSKDKALQAQQQINGDGSDRHDGSAIVLDSILDLSDFTCIEAYVQNVQTTISQIDVLIQNAGRNTSGKGQGKLDLMFQSNYLGHFYLSKLLMEAGLLKKGESKIVNVSSVMHHFCRDPHHDVDTVDYWKSRAVVGYSSSSGNDDKMPDGVYSATKLAAILHGVEWNRRYPGVPALAVNPGAVNSDIWRGFPSWMRSMFAKIYLTTQQGSVPLVAAAVRDDWNTDRSDEVLYLQPYWVPSTSSKPMIPFTEMLGPYVGYTAAAARLPPDGGQKAAKILWLVSEELIQQNKS